MIRLFSFILAAMAISCSEANKQDIIIDYLGQAPPGKEAVLFAEGMISTTSFEHSAPVFSPDGKTVLWSIMKMPSFLVSIANRQGRNLFKPIKNGDLTFSINWQLIHKSVFNFEPHIYGKIFYQCSIKIKHKQQLITIVPVKETAAGVACKCRFIYPAIVIGAEMFF